MSDCCAPAYGKVFGAGGARRAAKRYRRKGLDGTARWMVEFLRERGLAGATVLEVGGGVGGLHIELLRGGAARAVNVELSPEWEDEAAALLRDLGLEDRVERRIGDAVADAATLEPAGVVVMHRVVCCYPEAGRLMEVASQRAERFLALSFPRERPLARLFNRLGNLWMRVRGIPFRSYVHSERAIESAAEQRGLRIVAERRGRIWRVVAFERG